MTISPIFTLNYVFLFFLNGYKKYIYFLNKKPFIYTYILDFFLLPINIKFSKWKCPKSFIELFG